ncbi:MAG: hypothetical protein K8L97_30710 [Anaerolineae bacterium]|nr:hypothetical protein [Anaerolineae bacterium]
MANDTSSVLLSVCGIIGIVLALVILAALLLIRVLRYSVFGMARMLLNTITEPSQEQSALDVRAQTAPRPRGRDLRAQAKSLDFDAAVAKHTGTPNVRTTPAIPDPIPVQTAPPEQPTYDQPPALGKRRRRRNNDDEADDGLLDNMFDVADDGDGGLF